MSMKKILAILLSLLVVISLVTLTSCNSKDNKEDEGVKQEENKTDEQKDEATFERGTFDENGWQSEWMGLEFVTGSDMIMATASEIDAMMEIGADAILGKGEQGEDIIDFAKVFCVYEMMAVSPQGDNVIIMAEKLQLSNTTIEQYLEAFKTSLNATGITGITYSDVVKYTLAGQEFTRLDTSYSASGITVDQTYLFKKQEDRIIGIIFTEVNEGSFETMAAKFYAIK